jgi:hypothetical protein
MEKLSWSSRRAEGETDLALLLGTQQPANELGHGPLDRGSAQLRHDLAVGPTPQRPGGERGAFDHRFSHESRRRARPAIDVRRMLRVSGVSSGYSNRWY